MKGFVVFIVAILALIYLVNPTAGILEILPDNLPFVGNLDEAIVSYLVYSAMEYFRGRQIGIFGKGKTKGSSETKIR